MMQKDCPPGLLEWHVQLLLMDFLGNYGNAQVLGPGRDFNSCLTLCAMKTKTLIRCRAHAAPSTVMWLTGDQIPMHQHLLLRVATGEALLPLRRAVTQVDFSYSGA